MPIKGNFGKVSKATKKYVKSVIENTTEDKQSNVTVARAGGDAGMSWTGTVEPLVLIAQGVTNATRIGNAIRMKALRLALAFTLVPAALNSTIRYLVVQELSGTGVVPAISEILDGPPASENAPHVGLSFNESANKRFKVLLDRTISLNVYKSSRYVKVHNFSNIGKLGFIGTAADQASLGSRAIYLVTLSGHDPAGVNEPAIAFVARSAFEDA